MLVYRRFPQNLYDDGWKKRRHNPLALALSSEFSGKTASLLAARNGQCVCHYVRNAQAPEAKLPAGQIIWGGEEASVFVYYGNVGELWKMGRGMQKIRTYYT